MANTIYSDLSFGKSASNLPTASSTGSVIVASDRNISKKLVGTSWVKGGRYFGLTKNKPNSWLSKYGQRFSSWAKRFSSSSVFRRLKTPALIIAGAAAIGSALWWFFSSRVKGLSSSEAGLTDDAAAAIGNSNMAQAEVARAMFPNSEDIRSAYAQYVSELLYDHRSYVADQFREEARCSAFFSLINQAFVALQLHYDIDAPTFNAALRLYQNGGLEESISFHRLLTFLSKSEKAKQVILDASARDINLANIVSSESL